MIVLMKWIVINSFESLFISVYRGNDNFLDYLHKSNEGLGISKISSSFSSLVIMILRYQKMT